MIWSPSLMSEQIEQVGMWNIQDGLHISNNTWQFTAFKNKKFTITLVEVSLISYATVIKSHRFDFSHRIRSLLSAQNLLGVGAPISLVQ